MRITFLTMAIVLLVTATAATAKSPIQFYDATQWADRSGLSAYDQLNTSQTWFEPAMIADAQRAVDNNVGAYVIDIERPVPEFKNFIKPWLDEQGQDELSDQQLLAAIANVAVKVRKLQPGLRIGGWLEGHVQPGKWIDDLGGVETYNGTSKTGLPMAVDFIAINAHWHNNVSLDSWLSWKPDTIHEYREVIRCQLYATIETTAFMDGNGKKRGDVLSYEDLTRIVEAIEPNVNGIIWVDFPRVEHPYSDNLPYLKVTRDWQ